MGALIIGEATGAVVTGIELGRVTGAAGDVKGVDTGIEFGVAMGVFIGVGCTGADGVTGMLTGVVIGLFNGTGGVGGVGKPGAIAGAFGVNNGGVVGASCVGVITFMPFPLDFGELLIFPIFEYMPFPPFTGEGEVGDGDTAVGSVV